MAKIFISYVPHDREFVTALANGLRQAGHTIFAFLEDLAPGQRWREAIAGRLADADAVLVIISEASAHSQWMMAEMGMVFGYASQRGRPLIIPIVIDQSRLPPPLEVY